MLKQESASSRYHLCQFSVGYYYTVHPAPTSSIYFHRAHFNLHPATSISTLLFSVSTQLHPPALSSFQSPASSLQHSQQYLNQNIARNWSISKNLAQKIKKCPFWLKIGAHSISRMLILNLDLDFWNFDPKIQFLANLCPKTQSCSFCLKISTHGISRMLILFLTLVSWNSNPIFVIGQIQAKKGKVVVFNWKLVHMISWKCRFQIRT